MIISDTYAIFWREMKRYRKSKSGVIIRLIQPAIWIVVMGNIFAGTQPLIQSVGFDGEYIEFMAPGVLILTAIFTSIFGGVNTCLLYTSPSPRDRQKSRMPSSA